MRDFLEKFNIVPNDIDLYEQAMIHNSYANEQNLPKNYQRLEFLGDAILQFCVSEYLYNFFGSYDEGDLTKYRSAIVREASLSHVARNIELNHQLKLGVGEIKSKGNEKDSILADVFESITGAIYIDRGIDVTKKWLNETLFVPENISYFIEQAHDYKTELQELTQLKKRNVLKYVELEKMINSFNQTTFKIAVKIDDQIFGVGQGTSKKIAEQQAAKNALSKMKNV